MNINIGSRAPARRSSGWRKKASSIASDRHKSNDEMRTGPQSGPFSIRRAERPSPSARDLMRQPVPHIANALLRDAHVLVDHAPVDHLAVLHGGGTRARGAWTCGPS